jgi:hypothetical protein
MFRGDTPFRHPHLAISIFGIISILRRGPHRHLWHFRQHFRVKEPSSASSTSSSLIFWSKVIPINIFERILQALAKRGWHRVHWTSNLPEDRSFAWHPWMKVWRHVMIIYYYFAYTNCFVWLNCIMRSKPLRTWPRRHEQRALSKISWRQAEHYLEIKQSLKYLCIHEKLCVKSEL